MKSLSPYALGLLLLFAGAFPAHGAEPSTKLVITEGKSIGYASVADAMAALEEHGLRPAPGLNGNVSYVEPDNGTAWTFVGPDDPAYPTAVRYVYTRGDGVLQAEVTILCEASAARCEKFRSDIHENLAQLSRKMAGDPSANCSVSGNIMRCGAQSDSSKH